MMKQKINNYPLLFILLMILSGTMMQCSSTKSSTNMGEGVVEKMLNDHSFIFIAERMTPLRGRSYTLTSTYDVRVNNDSLVSYLPYFGRAYSAPMDPTKVGTQFTSTNFTYHIAVVKNNQWRISLVPKDVSSIQELVFTIFDNGSTSLNITSTSRDQISYSVYLKKIE
ncbi:MAG: DUF4251 domain-containing protein [Ginsengibacter sp.]